MQVQRGPLADRLKTWAGQQQVDLATLTPVEIKRAAEALAVDPAKIIDAALASQETAKASVASRQYSGESASQAAVPQKGVYEIRAAVVRSVEAGLTDYVDTNLDPYIRGFKENTALAKQVRTAVNRQLNPAERAEVEAWLTSQGRFNILEVIAKNGVSFHVGSAFKRVGTGFGELFDGG